MSERSKLLERVLRTWEHSEEGRGYLEWLLKSDAEVDGGDLLREAVLDVMEDDKQLNELRRKNLEAATHDFVVEARLPDEKAKVVKESTARIAANLSQITASKRARAQAVRKIRHALNRDRVETLEIVAPALRGQEDTDEIVAFLRSVPVAEELAAKLTALSRTTVASVDAEQEWQKSVLSNFPFDHWLESRRKVGDGWFDYISEELDRYYSHQLVARLEQIVERASSLESVKIRVADHSVKTLFLQAHEAFLYGFDSACIALCRSLIEHALRDKLGVSRKDKKNLQFMIEEAEEKKLLDGVAEASAQSVEEAGNHIMHNIPLLRSTAQTVLDHTRIVLNKLYGDAAGSETESD
jgi:hypothetical protein